MRSPPVNPILGALLYVCTQENPKYTFYTAATISAAALGSPKPPSASAENGQEYGGGLRVVRRAANLN